jgi:hypothetical protein
VGGGWSCTCTLYGQAGLMNPKYKVEIKIIAAI